MESLLDLKIKLAQLERKRDFFNYYGQYEEVYTLDYKIKEIEDAIKRRGGLNE